MNRCSRCSAALVSPDQFDRGLCASCLTGASLSALVGLAASHCTCGTCNGCRPSVWDLQRRVPAFKPPIYFGSDREWKREAFRNQADGTHQETQ